MYKVIISIILLLSTAFSCAQHDEENEKYEKFLKQWKGEEYTLAKHLEEWKEEVYTLAEHLENCKELKQEVKSVLGGTVERNVVGVVEEKCLYKEVVQTEYEVNCRYTEEERKVIAQQRRDMVDANILQTRIELTGSPSESKIKPTYIIDGKEMDDPLSQTMNDDTCEFSGR